MHIKLFNADIVTIKDYLRESLADVKSSHRVEALARGLGWQTNAAMRAELRLGPKQVYANETIFADYLLGHGQSLKQHALIHALAKVGILRAMNSAPTLTEFGFYVHKYKKSATERQAEFREWRERMPYLVSSFAQAYHYLSQFQRRKTINRSFSSYWLKHEAEKLGPIYGRSSYVGNGMLIAAAIAAEFKVQRCDESSLNAWLNISSKFVSPTS